jgi:hypothetical protein
LLGLLTRPDDDRIWATLKVVHGTIAYFGTYSIDETTHVLTVNVEGSSLGFNFVPVNVNRVAKRLERVEGNADEAFPGAALTRSARARVR